MRISSTAIGVVLLLALLGCGKSDGTDTVERPSISADVRAPTRTEVTYRDIEKADKSSASRAFLQFWSELQFQNWVDAVDRYSPGLRQVVGRQRMLNALRYQASFYRGVKPSVTRESRRRGLTTVRYSYIDDKGARRLNSTVWRRERYRWAIVFDGFLDSALQSWAQNREQQITAPGSVTPTKEALKAGIEASELQSVYLDSLRP